MEAHCEDAGGQRRRFGQDVFAKRRDGQEDHSGLREAAGHDQGRGHQEQHHARSHRHVRQIRQSCRPSPPTNDSLSQGKVSHMIEG